MKVKLIFLFCFFALALIACKKYTNVKKAAPEMTGDWVHYSANEGFHYIYIRENGRGSMYGINDHGNNSDPQERGWYIREDVLYFSRFQNKVEHEKFTIDQYPTLTDTAIKLEYDTIPSGGSYMILNQRTYRKTQ